MSNNLSKLKNIKSHNISYFMERMITGEITPEERKEYDELLVKKMLEI